MVPIKAASEAKPPPSPASPIKRRRAQQCRRCAGSPPPDHRHSRATECARLIPVTTRRRLVAKPRTPHLIPQAAQLFKIETANVRGQGARPLAFLWGFKRGYSLRKENTPFAWQQRKELHYLCSAAGAAPPIPPRRAGIKNHSFVICTPAVLSISFLVPTVSNATSMSASPPMGTTETTIPSPKVLWWI